VTGVLGIVFTIVRLGARTTEHTMVLPPAIGRILEPLGSFLVVGL